jgi:hypothetical protein
MSLVLLFSVTACAHAVPGVGSPADESRMSSQVLDPYSAERDIAQQFVETFGVGIDVSCTDEMHVITGANYECTGRTEDEENVRLLIVVTDAGSAAYTWDVA